MNIQITNEIYEQLEVKVDNDGDRITLRQQHRTRVGEGWELRVIILNKREALGVHQAISNAILNRKFGYNRI